MFIPQLPCDIRHSTIMMRDAPEALCQWLVLTADPWGAIIRESRLILRTRHATKRGGIRDIGVSVDAGLFTGVCLKLDAYFVNSSMEDTDHATPITGARVILGQRPKSGHQSKHCPVVSPSEFCLGYEAEFQCGYIKHLLHGCTKNKVLK